VILNQFGDMILILFKITFKTVIFYFDFKSFITAAFDFVISRENHLALDLII